MRFQLDPRGPSLYRPATPPSPPSMDTAASGGTTAGATAAGAPAASVFPSSSAAALARPVYAAPGGVGANGPASARPMSPLAPTLPRPRQVQAAGSGKPITKASVFAGLALVLLLGGGVGAAYWMELPPFEYPRRYMLSESEMPDRMALVDVSAAEEEFGITENPGRIDEDRLASFGQGPLPQPEEGWAEVLSPTSTRSPLVVAALRFADEDDARSWASLASMQCDGSDGALLRDGDVVVILFASGTTAQAYVPRVIAKLQEEAPALDPICGP